MLLDRWRQRVLPWRHIGATWRIRLTGASFGPLESRTETANGSVQPFLHSLQQKVSILYNGHPYPPELSFPIGYLDLPCNKWCFGPMRVHNPNGPRSVQPCLHRLPQSVPILVCLFPPQNCSSHVVVWTPCNTWFIGLNRVRNENGNLIVSAVFAGLTSVTDWQSDRQTDRSRCSVRGGVTMRN